MSRLKEKYSGQVEIKQLNSDDPATNLWKEKFGVQYLPTFVFLDRSGKVVDQAVGALPESMLESKIKALLKNSP